MRKVEVVPYQKEWPDAFYRERENIQQILGEQCIRVSHIGSTAIPEMAAKPVIDILVEVVDIQKVDHFNHLFSKLGYKACGENGILGRRFFMKGGNHRTHHIHTFQTGDPHILRHLAFRDYLRHHTEDASRYMKKKQELAQLYPFEMDQYIKGKDGLIKELEKKAIEWYKIRTL
ncbi:GrpB family protein [Alkalihalophilus pseudofirmus]|uniref:GrpB family protein n=1 Tax=Alkalihalophilus pseudofirmus TaxID=79885 RepID=UPI00259B6869|nr:GrpB family protein [Alkalihalophilus pseudofirmus]WEG18769.1 GrpB family protein [Alkalihalophilus pseudofirmus]